MELADRNVKEEFNSALTVKQEHPVLNPTYFHDFLLLYSFSHGPIIFTSYVSEHIKLQLYGLYRAFQSLAPYIPDNILIIF